MKARVAETQSDLFEVGVLSQTADVQSMALDQLAADGDRLGGVLRELAVGRHVVADQKVGLAGSWNFVPEVDVTEHRREG